MADKITSRRLIGRRAGSDSKKITRRTRILRLPLLALGLISAFATGCGGKPGAVHKISEAGVEVVLNRIEPYRIPGRPSTLTLQEIMAIDTEDDAVVREGVTDIYLFDVDPQGNIYIMVPPTHPGNLIFRLSPEGRPLLSFGPLGQGPFELEYPSGLRVDPAGRVWALESPKNKFHIFDASGKPLSESSLEGGFEDLIQLDNGNSLISRLEKGDLNRKFLSLTIGLYGEDFGLLREIDRFSRYPNKMIFDKVPEKFVCGTDYVFSAAAASAGRIFAGNSDRGYEILVFDLDGKLLRKVRKDYRPVPVSDEFRKKTLKMYEEGIPEYAAKIYFPDDWHPFQSFLADEEGRLAVMTNEPAQEPGAYLFDIFDQDGAFIARTSLSIIRPGFGQILAKIRGDRLYAVQEKPSGYKRLAVYRMIWS